MEYLTVAEIAKKWSISTRMVAYHCKSGRINGAVKKGKTWLIPSSAEKPADKRNTKSSKPLALNDQFEEIRKKDMKNHENIYHSSDLYRNLGLTRETLRYYEEIGLINPERNTNSQYREFTFSDAVHLMIIDFYKKRGFTPVEIRGLIAEKESPLSINTLEDKIRDMKKQIAEQQLILKRLEDSKSFYQKALKANGEIIIKVLPLYVVDESFDSVSALGKYQKKVINYLNLQQEDILSNMVRAISFDETEYKGSAICIVRQLTENEFNPEKTYLENGRCLYTILDADSEDDSIMGKMFYTCHDWADKHHEALKGVAYIFIRFVILQNKKSHIFYEVFVPLK